MNKNTNCPNCGAPITSNQCEYCGTVFSNFSDDTVQKVGLLRSEIEMLRQESLRESLYTAALTAMRNYQKRKKIRSKNA